MQHREAEKIHRARRRLWAVGLGLALLLACALAWRIRGGLGEASVARESLAADQAAREVPLKFEPVVRSLCALKAAHEKGVRRFADIPSTPLTVSHFCHLLRVFGEGPTGHPQVPSGRWIVRLLTDGKAAEAYFGRPLLCETRSGVRYQMIEMHDDAMPDAGEQHRDHCLATFAELGLPLSTPVTVQERTFSVREVLRDSLENFRLDQEELVWTADSYARYLPPCKTWRNRYGETFTFDDLAKELLSRPLRKSTCGGTHVLAALCALLRADASTGTLSEGSLSEGILSEPVQTAVVARLRECVERMVERQTEEGFWRADWAEGIGTPPDASGASFADTEFSRLLVTGHLAEFVAYFPQELQPGEDVYCRAMRWLYEVMDKMTPTKRIGLFCPCTHGVCALDLLRKVGRD